MESKELREKIDNINLKHMNNTGWNGHKEAEVYQAAMDEIMALITAEVERARRQALEKVYYNRKINPDDDGEVAKVLKAMLLQPHPMKGQDKS